MKVFKQIELRFDKNVNVAAMFEKLIAQMAQSRKT